MRFNQRTGAVVAGAVAAGILSAGAVAWACTPYPDGDSFGTTPQAPVSQDQGPAAQTVARPEAQPGPTAQAQPEVVATPSPATATTPAPALTTTRTALKAPVTSRRPVVGTAPPATSAAPAPTETAAVTPAPITPDLPSMSSVAGDLWSGFSAGSTGVQGPSLKAASTPVHHGTDWALGLGLFGAGLVALGAGTGVTLVRRTKVRANSEG